METPFLGAPVRPLGLAPADGLIGLRRRAAEEGDASAVSKELESLFATLLVKEMRRSAASGLFGEGSTGDIYGGWFDEQIGGVLAESGAIDLAGQIRTSLFAKSSAAPPHSEAPSAAQPAAQPHAEEP